mmetsp:Transcript_47760/g.103965  ORF Transcript_47760/g.103965 Transcript_47760/m.103965 type:complete len:237 (-) Transcript_47760:828-1538(-)
MARKHRHELLKGLERLPDVEPDARRRQLVVMQEVSHHGRKVVGVVPAPRSLIWPSKVVEHDPMQALEVRLEKVPLLLTSFVCVCIHLEFDAVVLHPGLFSRRCHILRGQAGLAVGWILSICRAYEPAPSQDEGFIVYRALQLVLLDLGIRLQEELQLIEGDLPATFHEPRRVRVGFLEVLLISREEVVETVLRDLRKGEVRQEIIAHEDAKEDEIVDDALHTVQERDALVRCRSEL